MARSERVLVEWLSNHLFSVQETHPVDAAVEEAHHALLRHRQTGDPASHPAPRLDITAHIQQVSPLTIAHVQPFS